MLIRNATVLSMDPDVGDLPHGDVRIGDDRIVEVGSDLQPGERDEVLDASGCILIPGFVDTHRHMWEGILRGHAADDTLDSYFRRVLLRIGPLLTPEDLAVGESLSARASLDAGITTVQDTSDIHDSPQRTDAVVAALQGSGLRTRFSYGLSRPYVMEHGAAFPDDVRRVRSELLRDDHALVTMGLETQNGDDDAERHNAALARELGVGTAHHVRDEIRPSRLRDLGALLPGTTFVHGNGLDFNELSLMAQTGSSLSIAPVVETVMGLGHPMIVEALAVPDLTVSLSGDVDITSPTDMFTQMRLLYTTARLASTSTGLSVRDVLRIATLGGARSLGLDGEIGSIAVGKQADLVLLRADRPDVRPLTDPYAAVVLQMDRSHVDTVLVAGVTQKRDGRSGRDDTALIEHADVTVRRLRAAGVLLSLPGRRDDAQPTGEAPPVADPLEFAMDTANARAGSRRPPSSSAARGICS